GDVEGAEARAEYAPIFRPVVHYPVFGIDSIDECCLVRPGQEPELTRDIGAGREMRLVSLRPAIEDIEAHAGSPELRGQARPGAVPPDAPALTRKIGATHQVRFIVVRAAVENVETHARTAEHGGDAEPTIRRRRELPVLAGDILEACEMRHVVLWAAIKNIERHVAAAELRAHAMEEIWIKALSRGGGQCCQSG